MRCTGRATAACGGVLVLALAAAPAAGQAGQAASPAREVGQTDADDYTSYELLAPETQQFRIRYDVTATTPGARHYFNPIRRGSEASDERVIDLATGAALPFDIVPGADAKRSGHPGADPDTNYIRVTLPRPVPAHGEVRLRIDKTYRDPKTYYREGDTIVFARSLGIKRNKVVLPAAYELVACNVPAQVLAEPDGRVGVSFMNAYPDAVSLVVKARPLAVTGPAAHQGVAGEAPAAAPPGETAPGRSLAESAGAAIPERGFQDPEIVYFLQPPETHAFDLSHDYTEWREGVDKYLNVVRAGSRVSNPSARNLDTGGPLTTETLRGAAALARAGIEAGEPVGADTEVVVVRFPAVKRGQSVRLRISETYTDPARYGVVGGTLVWRRSFGRPRNAVVLPAGWYVTASAIPGTVTLTEDGRVRLEFWNPRPDAIDVLLRAKRRGGPAASP
jgi:hypothetical protein